MTIFFFIAVICLLVTALATENAQAIERGWTPLWKVILADILRIVRPPEPGIAPAMPARRTEVHADTDKETQKRRGDSAGTGLLLPLSLLDDPQAQTSGYFEQQLVELSQLVESRLEDMGLDLETKSVTPGPVITRFELTPGRGFKIGQLADLSDDLARSLSVFSVRTYVEPGKHLVVLEIPNKNRQHVTLGKVLKSGAYIDGKSPLTLALGVDVGGDAIVADLARMPNLLIAGSTEFDTPVAINAMVLSILYKARIDQVRFIMIDPQNWKLSVYKGMPHLLTPVITDMPNSLKALHWCVEEMDRRYRLMAELGARHVEGYNSKLIELNEARETVGQSTLTPLPYIVIIIGELADLMAVDTETIETYIARLAQRARACGIHMILATQRLSTNVITGLIKACIPTRIAFQVSTKLDSRVILDEAGAQCLLGQGDMLYLQPDHSALIRAHGAVVSNREVDAVVRDLKESSQPPYDGDILGDPSSQSQSTAGGDTTPAGSEQDPLYNEAVKFVMETRRASVSGIQRRLKIGYNRAARIVDSMERAGVIGPSKTDGVREILLPDTDK